MPEGVVIDPLAVQKKTKRRRKKLNYVQGKRLIISLQVGKKKRE